MPRLCNELKSEITPVALNMQNQRLNGKRTIVAESWVGHGLLLRATDGVEHICDAVDKIIRCFLLLPCSDGRLSAEARLFSDFCS